ncbi:MAG: hypothetical protein FIB08_09345 [Candidatus Methanoperedens sp.]|nr:hypothetical protein [Candidatus Methanoperedens sp.]
MTYDKNKKDNKWKLIEKENKIKLIILVVIIATISAGCVSQPEKVTAPALSVSSITINDSQEFGVKMIPIFKTINVDFDGFTDAYMNKDDVTAEMYLEYLEDDSIKFKNDLENFKAPPDLISSIEEYIDYFEELSLFSTYMKLYLKSNNTEDYYKAMNHSKNATAHIKRANAKLPYAPSADQVNINYNINYK